MDIILRKIEELIPASYNPRRLTDKQFSDLKKSFKNLGTLEPAVINTYIGRENVIISGHQRLKVAQALGMTEYPCLHVNFDEKKEKEANIRMNKNTGEWDMDVLANQFEVEDLQEWGFDDLNFKIDEITEDEKVKIDESSIKKAVCPFCEKDFEING